MIVPLLAFDPDSLHRLGYGGGYYDRTIQALRRQDPYLMTIGIALECQSWAYHRHEKEKDAIQIEPVEEEGQS